jgi:hypothetical protein
LAVAVGMPFVDLDVVAVLVERSDAEALEWQILF